VSKINSTLFNISKHNDSNEWYTLPALVEVVQPFIKPNQVIWCPFDTSESAFVKVLSKTNQVIYSHIKTGQDFFSYEPTTHYDVIVSNPPFSKRTDVYKRLYELGKPWAMVANYTGLFDAKCRWDLFAKNNIQLLIPKGRAQFIRGEDGKVGKAAYQSIYVCSNMLPKQIVFSGSV